MEKQERKCRNGKGHKHCQVYAKYMEEILDNKELLDFMIAAVVLSEESETNDQETQAGNHVLHNMPTYYT